MELIKRRNFVGKKKICFLGFSLFSIGGAQRVTLSLANDLCKEYETHVISICEIENKNNYFVDEKVKIKSFGLSNNAQAREALKLFFKLKNYINENKIDVLFIAGSLPIPVISILRPFINAKIVFCDHENLAGRDKKSIIFRKIACIVSDKVVVLTDETMKDYKEKIGNYKNKFVQIYNSIDDTLLEKNIVCDINSKRILSVGRLSKEKGFDLAIDVAKKVFLAHPDWQWDIYGDGPEKEEILKKIVLNNLENNVFLKGSDPNVIEKYKNYSIFILPSYREGFAVVLTEAKLNGLPAVSFDCSSGPAEIISDSTDGFLIPCYNTEIMAEKICALIENPSLRKNFSEHSKDNLFKFSKKVIIKKWINLIENI